MDSEPQAWHDRPSVQQGVDGIWEYRASSVGRCQRSLWAARVGYDPLPSPEWLLRAAREGQRHEPWIVQDLEDQGINITHRQHPVALHFPLYRITGTLDGLARHNGTQRVAEFKTMSRAQFEKWVRQRFDAFPAYAAQATIYWHAVKGTLVDRLDGLLYAVKNRDNGDLKTSLIDEPPMDLQEIVQRLNEVELYVRTQRVPPDHWCPEDGFHRAHCPYRYLLNESGDTLADLFREKPDDKELYAVADLYKAGKFLLEQGEQMVEEAKGKFRQFLEQHGLKKHVAYGLSLIYVAANPEGVRNIKLKDAEMVLKQRVPDLADQLFTEMVSISPRAAYVRISPVDAE